MDPGVHYHKSGSTILNLDQNQVVDPDLVDPRVHNQGPLPSPNLTVQALHGKVAKNHEGDRLHLA